MSEVEFKVGDKVYCPHLTTRILKVVASENSPNLVAIESNNKLIDITTDGKVWNKQGLISDVFPATQENYELLSKLYPNAEFEPPPKRKEPREIIQALLDDGNSGVLCWVSNYYHEPSYNNSKAQIVTVVNDDDFYCSGCSIMQYATPIMPIKTFNQKIIDFVDGEVVLESENVN